ncbi:MAG: hypothetical protein WC314_07970 [Vulcanimicrobiota bacterium]
MRNGPARKSCLLTEAYERWRGSPREQSQGATQSKRLVSGLEKPTELAAEPTPYARAGYSTDHTACHTTNSRSYRTT